MGLFGRTQGKTNMAEFSAECHGLNGSGDRNIGFNKTTDSNKIKVIILDNQKSRELRRIRTMHSAVYFYEVANKYT